MENRVPLSRDDANTMAGSMIDAALVLLELPDIGHINIERLISHAELLLELAGDWVPRRDALAIWTSMLDDGVIPLEATAYLGLAEALLQHHDHLTDLLRNY